MIRSFLGLCCLLYLTTLIFNLGATWWVGAYALEKDHEDTVNLSRGMIHLMREGLRPLSPEERVQKIVAWGPEFGFDLRIDAMKDLEFAAPTKQALDQGDIVITPLNYGGNDTLHFQLLDSGQVVSLGPIVALSEWEQVVNSLNQLYALVIFLAVFAWVARLNHRLKVLHGAAQALGNGHLEKRLKVNGKDLVASLANSFNQMATRLQRLVQGHMELTNAVSHEIRTPLARITFETEMLRQAQTSEKRTRHLAGIDADVAELNALTAELLTYARFDRAAPWDLQPVAIASWLQAWVADWRSPAPMRLDCFIPEALEDWQVALDPHYLQRALSNLLSNAARHGGSQAQIVLEQINQDCLVHVDDNGPGIPENRREDMFQPFSLLDESRHRESGGFGMGLAIVAQIMRGFKGEATIHDSPLGGARITLRWPTTTSM